MNGSNRVPTILLIVVWVTAAAALAIGIVTLRSLPPQPAEDSAELARKLAGELADQNLPEAAIEEYNRLLNSQSLSDPERGAIYYMMANLYFEEIGDYQQAAAHYIRACALDENASYQLEAGKNLIASLEKMGRRLDARRELDRQAGLTPDTTQTPGKIVASLGSRKITLADFNEAYDDLPQELQSQFAGFEGKKNFLNQLIGRELIHQAALREGLDRDGRLRRDLNNLEKEYLVQFYIQEKILPSSRPDTSGLNLFYQAHQMEYGDKTLNECRDQVTRDYVNYLSQQAVNKYIDDLLRAEPVQTFEENLK